MKRGWWLYLIVDHEDAIPLAKLSNDQAVTLDDWFEKAALEQKHYQTSGPWGDSTYVYKYEGVFFTFWHH